MYSEDKNDRTKKERRAKRVRRELILSERPRLSVFRSAKHISVQVIDDRKGITLVGIGSYDKELREIKNPKEVARKVGLKIADLAKKHEVTAVVFDRGKYKYHGRIAALADGAREGGLQF